eukprot:1609392-Amphidinium_carterae.1
MWSSPSVPSRLGCAFGAARPQVDVVVSKADHAGQAERTTQRSLRALATTAGFSHWHSEERKFQPSPPKVPKFEILSQTPKHL